MSKKEPAKKPTVTAYAPNDTIKKALGDGITARSLMTPQVVAACDGLIQTANDDFFTDAKVDLMALEILAREYRTTENIDRCIQNHSYQIKSYAKVLGFYLITEICIHLVAATDSTKLGDERKIALIGKLVEALGYAFKNQIRDDGGPVGKQLMSQLKALE